MTSKFSGFGKAALLLALLAFAGPAEAQTNILKVLPTSATPGGTVSSTVVVTHDLPMQGFQVAVSYDNSILTFDSVTTNNTDLVTLLSPNGVEFSTPTSDASIAPGLGWAAFGAIFDFQFPFTQHTLPGGTEQSLVHFSFDSANSPALVGTSTTITLENGMGSPPLFNILTITGSSVLPDRIDGTVDFIDSPLFRRGDPNQDGQVNLADAIFLIQYLFNDGPAPACLSAASSNGDNLADLSDAIFLIQYNFNDGSPPPSPFPACGAAPGTDTLGCSKVNSL